MLEIVCKKYKMYDIVCNYLFKNSNNVTIENKIRGMILIKYVIR